MNRKELNKFDMLKSVYAFLKEHEALIAGIPSMTELMENLGTLIQTLNNLAVKQETETESVTAEKLRLEALVIDLLTQVVEALAAHAVASQDVALEARVAISESGIKKLRSANLITKSRYVSGIAAEYTSKLMPYGVTEAVLGSLTGTTNTYEESALGKRSIQEKTISATQSIDLEFKAGTALLKRIDKLLKPVCRQNPTFEQEYAVARRTVNIAATRKSSNGGNEPPA